MRNRDWLWLVLLAVVAAATAWLHFRPQPVRADTPPAPVGFHPMRAFNGSLRIDGIALGTGRAGVLKVAPLLTRVTDNYWEDGKGTVVMFTDNVATQVQGTDLESDGRVLIQRDMLRPQAEAQLGPPERGFTNYYARVYLYRLGANWVLVTYTPEDRLMSVKLVPGPVK